jgi:hypothetical protein
VRNSTCVGGVTSCTPGSPTGGDTDCDGIDDDCDGSVDESYSPTYCGTGACRRASTCVGGYESCTPGTGSPDTDCDGIDDDCDGTADESYVPTYTCGVGACVRPSTCSGGVESCAPGPPSGDDSDCDGVDDDCDGGTDEAYTSTYTCGVGACVRGSVCVGGMESCTPGAPGTDNDCDGVDDDCDGLTDEHWVATTCGVGACQRTATCTGGAVHCTPGSPTPDTTCNGIDEDCDGLTDEHWVATTCGVGACLRTATCTGGTVSCTPGGPTGTPETVCNGVDDDCDGSVDENWVTYTCGSGGCIATATCVGGVEQCIPGTGGPDTDCDLVDDDCDTVADDDYVSYTCGSGSCTATSTCVLGVESCTPPTGSPDTDCDGVDDDCDTVPDDDYVPTFTCGVGACLRDSTCSGGVESCSPGAPGTDDDCDGVDDDCDGTPDDNYSPYYCGTGACRHASTCVGGFESCSPGSPTGDDSDCDGVDDDCDGSTDELWTPYTCGIGACQRTATCIGGVASCTAGSPTGPDTDCDGIDDNCNGATDENFTPSTCGLGVCQRDSICVGGVESCTPGPATGTDQNCNGVDEDCDGTPDDGWIPWTCGSGPCMGTATCIGGVENCTTGTGSPETCNGADDDCDTVIDDGTPTELCGSIPHATPQCAGGVCSIASCDAGWYNLDGLFGNGCECGIDTYEPAGASCSGAINIGTLNDSTSGYFDVTGNIVPTGDEDWYKITVNDDPDSTQDEFNFEAYFVTNPGNHVIDVYEGSAGGCSDPSPCTAVPDCYSFYTDFFNGTNGESPCGTAYQSACTNNTQTFYIRVRRTGGSTTCASYTLRLRTKPSTYGPGCTHPTRNCSTAPVLTQNGTTSGSMSGQNNDNAGTCGGFNGPDAVYRLVLTSASDVFIAAFSTAFNPILYMSPTCGLSTSGCNDNAHAGVGSSVVIGDNLAAGTYYVVVDSVGPTTGAFTLETYVNANKVLGDTCGQPRLLQHGASGTTCDYTHDLSPTCQDSGCTAPDVVFYFIKETTGGVGVDTCDYSTDSLVSFRNVCTTNGSDLDCDDDWCYDYGPGGYGSYVYYSFSPGVYFYVQDGYCSGCGSYSLYVTGL